MPMLVRAAPIGHLVVDRFVSDDILSLLELDQDEVKDKGVRYGILGGDDISRMIAINHFPILEQGQPKPTNDQAVDVRCTRNVSTSLAALFFEIIIYNKLKWWPHGKAMYWPKLLRRLCKWSIT